MKIHQEVLSKHNSIDRLRFTKKPYQTKAKSKHLFIADLSWKPLAAWDMAYTWNVILIDKEVCIQLVHYSQPFTPISNNVGNWKEEMMKIVNECCQK